MATQLISQVDKYVYPFSTREGEPIPLEVLGPQSAMIKTFAATGTTDFMFPDSFQVGSFYSPTGCFIQFEIQEIPAPLIDGTEYPQVLFVPPGVIITAAILPGLARVIAYDTAEDGHVVIQNMRKWAALALKQQTRIK